MFLKNIKMQFRDFKNFVTGKQAAIDEYNTLTLQIYNISDRMSADNPMKQNIIENMQRICETKFTEGPYGSFFIDCYNPWDGGKSATNKKVMELKKLLKEAKKAQTQNVR